MPFAAHKPTHHREQPVNEVHRIASGDTGALEGFGSVNSIRAQLHVTEATGGPGRLNVSIEDSLDGGETWNVLAAFDERPAAGRQVLNVPAPFGDTVRVAYTIDHDAPEPTKTARTAAQKKAAAAAPEQEKAAFTFAVDWTLTAGA